MRPALRGAIAAVVATGLVTSAVVTVAGPADAADRADSTVGLSVLHTPNIGRTCVFGVTVTTVEGQVGGLNVAVQRKVDGKWANFRTISTKATRPVRVEIVSVEKVTLRAFTNGNTKVGADRAPAVTCTPKSLGYGSTSSTVAKVQKKLRKLRIRPASTSGVFDANTLQAVYAFQKANGLERTGVVNAKVYNRIMATTKIKAPKWCDPGTTMCIDISKQTGYLLIGGKRYVIPVSSGGGYYFYNPQSKLREFARTPRGQFRVYYKVPGPTTGPLGTYYWISFFTGGYGVHGSASVPTYPASHGCVREPRSIEQWVYRHLPVGAGVHVHQ